MEIVSGSAPPSACGRAVIPELLKGFLKKVGTYGLQVVTEQIAQPEALFRLQILVAFEQQPAPLLQHGHAALARYAARFSRSDFVQCLVHFRHDVKTIEDVKRLGAFLANDFLSKVPTYRSRRTQSSKPVCRR